MPSRSPYSHVGVVVPAHNELADLPRCLRALLTAAACAPAPVSIVVVLDDCDDGSVALAGRFGPDVHFVTVAARNVGAARAAGFVHAKTLCEVDTPAWYATTDADSAVDPDWLVRQLSAGADMVLGVVRVTDWRHLPAAAIRRYLRAYQARRPGGHHHIHGANMGFRADAYWRLGGFRALPTGEDVELVGRFEAAGYRIHRDAMLSVSTSARRDGRAPGGFAHYLRGLTRHSENRHVAEDFA
jgi:glycosyltransferase involved in cell wall biosynthesis